MARAASSATTKGEALQRFFSTFPAHWPGVGLVVLRMAAGGVAAMHGSLYLVQVEEPTATSWAVGVVLIVGAMGLITGFMTPGAAGAVSLTTIYIAATWLPLDGPPLLDRVGASLVIVDALALAVLGPGAYSVDAHLFGRREILIPNDKARR